jgi:hypothetical protein
MAGCQGARLSCGAAGALPKSPELSWACQQWKQFFRSADTAWKPGGHSQLPDVKPAAPVARMTRDIQPLRVMRRATSFQNAMKGNWL